MSDALVAPSVAATMALSSIAVAGYSLKKLNAEDEHRQLPLMGILGAFVFAVQMINFSIPGTGASGHLTGGLLLTALLGPYAGFVTMIAILMIQCLLFADGGLLALGCNIWNMAFYGCFVGGLLIWKLIMCGEISKKKIFIASILGSVISLQLGAFSVVVETMASGITELPFNLFVSVMQPIHLAIGLVEGVITATVVCFVYQARPQLIWTSNVVIAEKSQITNFRNSYRQIAYSFAIAFLIAGGSLTLLASSAPDGLEWSVNKVNGHQISGSSHGVQHIFEQIQNVTSLLPDYSLSNHSTSGTSLSGILGGVLVMALLFAGGRVVRCIKRK